MIYNTDCIEFMKKCKPKEFHTTLTDIPYDAVSRSNNGLLTMINSDKGNADKLIFDLDEFLELVYNVTSDNIIIFCGKEQFSEIFKFFANKQGTTRHIVWKKTNPVPSNGKYVYLSGVEEAVWFKKPKGTFNAFCKNTVFEYPSQSKQIHPTEKNHKLFEELILDNSNEGDVIFDPCMGSAVTGLMAYKNNRKFVGCEIDKEYFDVAKKRLNLMGYELD